MLCKIHDDIDKLLEYINNKLMKKLKDDTDKIIFKRMGHCK